MLLLTRKLNEGILIGKDIVVTVVNIEKDKIRLGIEAPRDIRVIREELIAEIGQENMLAAQSQFLPINKNKQASDKKELNSERPDKGE